MTSPSRYSSGNHRIARIVTAAAFLPAMVFAISSFPAFAAESIAQATPTSGTAASSTPPSASPVAPKGKGDSVNAIDARISALHKQLGVTADQEAQWTALADVMRDNGRMMRDSVSERSAKLKTMSAVDDLRSYEKIAQEHADGLKQLVPAFEALYAKMTPSQQKNADHVFGEQQRKSAARG
jgi:protein CpxP